MENSIAMNGGDGPNSYSRNSKIQEEGSDSAKVLLSSSILENISSKKPQTFCIADLGCSVGPNTFSCVQTIIEAVKLKFKQDSELPEFHVFFSDHVANDFNTLFKALSSIKRQYMAAGVPGSFHGRLFPKTSINFMHSSYALHWLTKVPEQVTREGSLAWNKGRISCAESSNEVVKAYTDQFLRDMANFTSARSVEMVDDGLMAILMPCRQEGTLASDSLHLHIFECLGYALTDMVKEGLVDEALVDSFNIPIFIPTASEVKQVVSSNRNMRVERIHLIYTPPKLSTDEHIRLCNVHVRATMEGIFSKHFGSQVIDELFHRYSQKLEEFSQSPFFTRIENVATLFMLVKRITEFA